MKKLVIAIFTLASGLTAVAQNVQIDQFFQKYEGKPGFTSVNVSEKLFTLFASAAGDDPELQSVVEGLKGIKVLVYENEEGTSKSAEYYKEFSTALPQNIYEELMTVNSENDKVIIMGKLASEKVLDELLVLCDADGEFVLVSIIGKIDIEKISKLSDIDIDGLDELEKMDDK
ncbi:MAG: DUF4252 domain-containing protein [Chitinophagales bacterium]